MAAILGPWGVFCVSLADSALIPMPQGVDALLIAQAIASPEIAYLAAGLGVAGSVAGSAILYLMGRRAGLAVLRARVSERGIERLSGLVGRWGPALLIPVSLIPLPLPMKPVVLAAGIFQMPLPSFCLALGIARGVRYFGVVYLALRFGERALDLAMENLHLALVGVLLLVVVSIAAQRLSNRWLQSDP